MERASVAVIGTGGVGSLVATHLLERGHDVVLCGRRPVDELVVQTPSGTRRRPVRAVVEGDAVTPVDWVVLTVKGHQTPGAVPWLRRLATDTTVVAALQNGTDHRERLAQLGVRARVLPVLVQTYAEGVAPGVVRHVKGDRLVAPDDADGAAFRRLVEGSGLRVALDPDFTTAVWRKLMGNLAANPVTALTVRRGAVLHEPATLALCAAVMRECVAVARAEGAALGEADVEQLLDVFRNYPDDGGTSMLWDRLAGRPMEHELLTGGLVRAARRHAIAVPRNEALLALLRAVDDQPPVAEASLS